MGKNPKILHADFFVLADLSSEGLGIWSMIAWNSCKVKCYSNKVFMPSLKKGRMSAFREQLSEEFFHFEPKLCKESRDCKKAVTFLFLLQRKR
jgi:hypothetical protein